MNTYFDASFDRITKERLTSEGAGARRLRIAPVRGRRHPRIYILCAGFFCLGIILIAMVAGEGRFIATAAIHADSLPSHPIELPLASSVPEPVLRAVVEAQGLAEDPEFVSQQWDWIARVALVFGVRNFADHQDAHIAQAIASLEHAVTLKIEPLENRLDVEVRSADASKAARIADGLAQAVLEDQKDRAREKDAQIRRSAEAAVTDSATRLQMAKQKLADFQTAQNAASSGDETASISGHDPGDPEAPVAEAKADVDRISRALASGRTSSLDDLHFPTPDLDRLALQYDELRQQLEKRKLSLGDKHPDIVALEGQLRALQKEIHGQWQKSADMAGRNYRLAQARVLAFGHEPQAAFAGNAPGPLLASPEKLQSDVDQARGDYEHALRLQTKAESTVDMQPSWSLTKAQVASSATHAPQGLILGAVLMLGAMFGAGRTLAGGGQRRSRRWSFGAGEVQDAPPSMFPIPRIKGDWLQERLHLKPGLDVACQEVLDRPRSDFSRAIEHLFELETDASANETMKLLFVSKDDKLGTTTVAVNFAHVAAKAGHRVLLIEANRHRPILASLMSPNVRVNLIDLHGTKRVICQLRPRLSIIPLFDGETSIFLAERAHHCVRGINRHFDVVILDGGRFVADDEMMDMTRAVNRVFHLTPQGLEWKAGGRAFGSGF